MANYTTPHYVTLLKHIRSTTVFSDTSAQDPKVIKGVAMEMCTNDAIPLHPDTYELISNYFQYIEDKDRMLVYNATTNLWGTHRGQALLENFLQDYFTVISEEASNRNDFIHKEYAKYFFSGKRIHYLAERIKNSMLLHIGKSYDLVTKTENLRYFNLTEPASCGGKYRALLDISKPTFNLDQTTWKDTMPLHLTHLLPSPIASDDTDIPTLWLSLIEEYMLHDPERIEYFHKILAYLMSPYNYNQALIYFVGEGRNGKSTILKVLQDLLGPHAVRINSDMLNAKPSPNFKKDDALASMEGKSLLIFNEIDERMTASTQNIKDITEGGRDEFGNKIMTVVRPAYSPSYEVNICGIPLVVANNLIRFGDWANLAPVFRRLVVVPFDFTIQHEDPTILTRLAQEYPKIQLWLYMNYFKHKGIRIKEEPRPASYTQLMQDYRKDSDILQMFVEDCIEETTDVNDYIQCGDLYRMYTKYCRVNGRTAIGNKGSNSFASLITAHLKDPKVYKTNGAKVFRYIKQSHYYVNEVNNAPTFA